MKAQTNHSIIDSHLQQKLRKNMTDAEIRLWQRLRGRQIAGCKFRRQHPFLDYVLDFVCLEKRLVVEVDGGQHLENERDQLRDGRLHEAGFRVLRFWNNQVLHETDAVVEVIWAALQSDAPVATPSPPRPSP
ncbi:MAG: endonuclease domain-containing protein [Pseudomonadota bacterium]